MPRLLAVNLPLLLALAATPAPLATAAPDPAPGAVRVPAAKAAAPVVELAILLDTSNSMDGLIDQARAQLWGIVNRVASKTRGGQAPRLRVALYEYGNSSIPVEAGYVRLVQPLTGDLDLFSRALFELTTNGGDEYCGEAIGRAVEELEWSPESVSGSGFRAIYIAGNEPFTQGERPYASACAAAVGKGVRVNTIHCGPEAVGAESGWRDGAERAEGDFLNINQDAAVAVAATPMDARLADLSREINGTYAFFGGQRRELEENQKVQDRNASRLGRAIAAERAATKSGPGYRNRADLVDATLDAPAPAAALAAIPAGDLPEEMRAMTDGERLAHVEKLAAERAALQAEIQELSIERDAFLADLAAGAADGPEAEDTFGSAILASVDRQMEAAGFEKK
ncbi:vWA domain-containing protein [Phycisphaera mikurensis]|uniref:VWFA domain-containing protein n=1 Tax=Phycisphaera mikurensis (strain NBRC 102666 / KCTC 22515 / FYK2301M01) TaxID=1142394 RepID=I0IIR5_PHYMF|nr:vWA domain-containing protein [Phycisphaera mikurensis]MBB6442697.1 hypothetical protein [Phycisphaera mikurensis]BAM05153.1 hypothetical protein PSMK_29940 [Phycisphaera mikurensis NBRC 102666]